MRRYLRGSSAESRTLQSTDADAACHNVHTHQPRLKILACFLGQDERFLGDVLAQDRNERGLLEIVHNDAHRAFGVAIHERQLPHLLRAAKRGQCSIAQTFTYAVRQNPSAVVDDA